jgi:hypothetical protein
MMAVALGLLVAVAPQDWLTVITDVAWEQSIISLTGLAGAGLVAALPWARASGGHPARRAHIWVSVFAITGAVYVISVSPLYLIIAFCSAFVGMLDIWMARAHIASMSLRADLGKERG